MKSVSSLMLFCILSLSNLAHADEKHDLAARLVEKLGYLNQYENSIKECLKSSQTASVKDILKSDSNHFPGITPQSKYWPELKAILSEYRSSSCSYTTAQQFVRQMEEGYANRLSVKELQAALDYYSSTSGRKMVETNIAVSLDMQRKALHDMESTSAAASEVYAKRISALAIRYENDKEK
jgi:hypothetical protein